MNDVQQGVCATFGWACACLALAIAVHRDVGPAVLFGTPACFLACVSMSHTRCVALLRQDPRALSSPYYIEYWVRYEFTLTSTPEDCVLVF